MSARISFKDMSVCLSPLVLAQPEMIRLLRVLARTAPLLYEETVVVTSIHDGRHGRNSLHYRGKAMDVRFLGQRPGGIVARDHVVQKDKAYRWQDRLRRILGADFDVVLEKDHLHIELDPKG